MPITGHGLQQCAVDSAIDGECVLASAYGPKEDILSSGSMCLSSERLLSSEAMFQIRMFFKSVHNSQSYHKSSIE